MDFLYLKVSKYCSYLDLSRKTITVTNITLRAVQLR